MKTQEKIPKHKEIIASTSRKKIAITQVPTLPTKLRKKPEVVSVIPRVNERNVLHNDA